GGGHRSFPRLGSGGQVERQLLPKVSRLPSVVPACSYARAPSADDGWSAKGGGWSAEGGGWSAEGGGWSAEGGGWSAKGGGRSPRCRRCARPAACGRRRAPAASACRRTHPRSGREPARDTATARPRTAPTGP